jgi:hypothetical protein
MKTLQLLLLGFVLVVPAFATETVSDADKKWSEAVEKLIAAGNTTISTPVEKRVEIARKLAEKAGRKVEVVRAENSYRITVRTLTAAVDGK